MNTQQETPVHAFDTIEDQRRGRQDGLRMARGKCHCKSSIKQNIVEMFWDILSALCCTESAEDPIITLRRQRFCNVLQQFETVYNNLGLQFGFCNSLKQVCNTQAPKNPSKGSEKCVVEHKARHVLCFSCLSH